MRVWLVILCAVVVVGAVAYVAGAYPPCKKGDVVEDNEVNLFDVLRTSDIALEIPPTPTDYEWWAADAAPPPDGDDDVNLFDVTLIAAWVLGNDNPPDTCTHTPTNTPTPTATDTATDTPTCGCFTGQPTPTQCIGCSDCESMFCPIVLYFSPDLAGCYLESQSVDYWCREIHGPKDCEGDEPCGSSDYNFHDWAQCGQIDANGFATPCAVMELSSSCTDREGDWMDYELHASALYLRLQECPATEYGPYWVSACFSFYCDEYNERTFGISTGFCDLETLDSCHGCSYIYCD